MPVTAVIPAHRRLDKLLNTLQIINGCEPAPSEILVHVDGASSEIVQVLEQRFPQVRVLSSQELVGPGGARNRLIEAANNELVANFDDDSFPAHQDYFENVLAVARLQPDAAIFSAQIMTHLPKADEPAPKPLDWQITMFAGCGCVFRKSWFVKTQGFVPIPLAYFMEEADLSLQLHALGAQMVQTSRLRVCHLNPREGTPNTHITSYSIANIALLGYLRYPPLLWPLIPLQITSRILWLSQRRWFKGIVAGLFLAPSHVMKYASYRKRVSARAVLSWLIERRRPESLTSV